MSEKVDISREAVERELVHYAHSTIVPIVRALLAANESLAKDAERLDWLEKHVTHIVHTQGDELKAHKTIYKLPLMVSYAEFCGDIGFREAIDYRIAEAIAASASAKERTP